MHRRHPLPNSLMIKHLRNHRLLPIPPERGRRLYLGDTPSAGSGQAPGPHPFAFAQGRLRPDDSGSGLPLFSTLLKVLPVRLRPLDNQAKQDPSLYLLTGISDTWGGWRVSAALAEVITCKALAS